MAAAAVFSMSRILLTATACALVALLILGWQARRTGTRETSAARVVIALSIGVLVVVWRAVSNALQINEDFLPGVSLSDVGSGVLSLLGLLALTPPRPSGHAWMVTSALIALAAFVCNVVLI